MKKRIVAAVAVTACALLFLGAHGDMTFGGSVSEIANQSFSSLWYHGTEATTTISTANLLTKIGN